jgi:hypothetical protein
MSIQAGTKCRTTTDGSRQVQAEAAAMRLCFVLVSVSKSSRRDRRISPDTHVSARLRRTPTGRTPYSG